MSDTPLLLHQGHLRDLWQRVAALEQKGPVMAHTDLLEYLNLASMDDLILALKRRVESTYHMSVHITISTVPPAPPTISQSPVELPAPEPENTVTNIVTESTEAIGFGEGADDTVNDEYKATAAEPEEADTLLRKRRADKPKVRYALDD